MYWVTKDGLSALVLKNLNCQKINFIANWKRIIKSLWPSKAIQKYKNAAPQTGVLKKGWKSLCILLCYLSKWFLTNLTIQKVFQVMRLFSTKRFLVRNIKISSFLRIKIILKANLKIIICNRATFTEQELQE